MGKWVGQDYFSPQSFNYLLYLLFVGVRADLVPDPAASKQPGRPAAACRRIGWPRRGLEPGELPARPTGGGERAVLLAIVASSW